MEPTAAKPSKRTVEGGVVVEDVKEGHGPEAKSGKLVSYFLFFLMILLLYSDPLCDLQQ